MHALVRAVMQAISIDAAFTDADWCDAKGLIQACCIAITGDFNPSDVSHGMECLRYHGPSRPWLNAIRQAIDKADIDPLDQASLRGAFYMATVILFDAYKRRLPEQRGISI